MARYTTTTLPILPITPAVAEILGKLDGSLGDVREALALPLECYTVPAWYEFERRAIFDNRRLHRCQGWARR